MKTDELIAMLARDAGPVARDAARGRFALALLAGSVAALALMIALMGVRADIADAVRDPMFWVKLGVPTLLVGSAYAACTRAGRPGAIVGPAAASMLLPVAAIWLLAALALAAAPADERTDLILGDSWSACLASIPLLAFPAFAAALWAMKGLAPTRPALAGALSGLLAGAAGAVAYTLHCPEMAAPFIATWYVLGMAIPAAIGALAGPALLRW